MFNKSRRTFIKGAACTAALAVSGVAALSSTAMANDEPSQQQAVGTEVICLINHTASPVILDRLVTIAPGEQRSFVVSALNSDDSAYSNNKNLFITDVLIGQLAISSDYPEFNGIVPTNTFSTQAA